MSSRSKARIISEAHSAEFPLIEYHLIRTSKFFADENIFTTFPECRDYIEQHSASGPYIVYLLCTFQPNVGEAAPATTEELLREREAFEKGIATHRATYAEESARDTLQGTDMLDKDDQFSSLASYTPQSIMWKDKSGELFFQFMERVKTALSVAMKCESNGASSDSAGSSDFGVATSVSTDANFFLDWPDPASGLPMRTHRGSSVFVDSDIIEQYFPFSFVVVPAPGGSCRMASHPVYGWNMYPATAVIAAPTAAEAILVNALESLAK